MNHLKDWITRHQLMAFFLVGIALCFGTLFPVILVIPQESMIGQILGYYLAKIGVYSPVLAGMFVARIVQPGCQRVSLTRRLLVFLPVWFIAVIIHIASFKLTAPSDSTLIGLFVLSLPVALLPALVITSAISGADGVKQLLATLVRPKGNIFYYLVALLTFPIIHIVGTGVTNIMNGDAWFPRVIQGADLVFTTFITFFSVLLFSGGINEESGWRGFAQRRLQVKYSPLVGWIYNRTKGSILAPAIFHASMNSMNPLMGTFPISTAVNILLVSLAVVAIIYNRMWKKLPSDHPAVYRDPALEG
jgi:membrane protease YdiL (CAAX protease family)